MFKIIRYKVWLLYIIIGVVVLFSPMSTNASEVTTYEVPEAPIAISDFKMNMNEVKSDDTIQYSFTIEDVEIKDFLNKYGEMYYECYPEYYGVFSVTLCWKSSKKQIIYHTYTWKQVDGWNTKNIKIKGKIPVEKGMQTGEWHLASIFFDAGVDGAGFSVVDNRHSTNEKHSYCPDPLMDLSVADFKVSGTGKADNKAPTIDLKSLKLSKRYVKKNQKTTFSVKVKDQSKIAKVECTWGLYADGNRGKEYDWINTHKMKYNKKTKKYQCTMKLAYKKAQLTAITVTDIYGNEKIYSVDNSSNYTPKKKDRKYYNAYKKMLVIAK